MTPSSFEGQSPFLVVNPTAPRVVLPDQYSAYAEYQKQLKSVTTLRKSNIECVVGDPLTIVHKLFST
ncbi:MAG: hypothetical protein ACYC7D_05455 [Nitrososphaerales archaeon]